MRIATRSKKINGILVGLMLNCHLAAEANALTLSTPGDISTASGNPATASIPATPFDGGVIGPAVVTGNAEGNFTFITPNISVTNPTGNVMGDDVEAFIDASHFTNFDTVSLYRLNPKGWRVRLDETGASFVLTTQATANQQLVNGVTQTVVFNEASGCEIGEFCEFDFVDEFSNVNISGVNEIGLRWTFVADGALTVNVVPEPGSVGVLAFILLLSQHRRYRQYWS